MFEKYTLWEIASMGSAVPIWPLFRTNKAHTFSPTSAPHDINAAAKYGQTSKEYNHCSYSRPTNNALSSSQDYICRHYLSASLQ